MTNRTNRYNSTNGEEWGGAWGSIENLGEYGWWGNRGIFGSRVKYGVNMEGAEKCVEVWGKVREGVGKVLGCKECGKVWGGVADRE